MFLQFKTAYIPYTFQMLNTKSAYKNSRNDLPEGGNRSSMRESGEVMTSVNCVVEVSERSGGLTQEEITLDVSNTLALLMVREAEGISYIHSVSGRDELVLDMVQNKVG